MARRRRYRYPHVERRPVVKASAEFRALVAAAIEPHDTETNRDRYRRDEFPRANRTKDKNKRYRWDLYWHAHATAGPFYTIGLNDAHLDTMLRSIVAPLTNQ